MKQYAGACGVCTCILLLLFNKSSACPCGHRHIYLIYMTMNFECYRVSISIIDFPTTRRTPPKMHELHTCQLKQAKKKTRYLSHYMYYITYSLNSAWHSNYNNCATPHPPYFSPGSKNFLNDCPSMEPATCTSHLPHPLMNN